MEVKYPRPVFVLDASQNAFDQFCFEWKFYSFHYHLSQDNIASHLLSCGSEDVCTIVRFTTSTQHLGGRIANVEGYSFVKD